jgi:hypothetical protein
MKMTIKDSVPRFEIGDRVVCRNESNQTMLRFLGRVEYVKNGWVGVRSIIYGSGEITSTLIPQRPENLMPIEL